jgi:hypothetical protein
MRVDEVAASARRSPLARSRHRSRIPPRRSIQWPLRSSSGTRPQGCVLLSITTAGFGWRATQAEPPGHNRIQTGIPSMPSDEAWGKE